MSNYGYIKEGGTNPNHNIWTHSREITLLDNSIVLGYEGEQEESDDNVEIIGDSTAFSDWRRNNTIIEEIE